MRGLRAEPRRSAPGGPVPAGSFRRRAAGPAALLPAGEPGGEERGGEADGHVRLRRRLRAARPPGEVLAARQEAGAGRGGRRPRGRCRRGRGGHAERQGAEGQRRAGLRERSREARAARGECDHQPTRRDAACQERHGGGPAAGHPGLQAHGRERGAGPQHHRRRDEPPLLRLGGEPPVLAREQAAALQAAAADAARVLQR
mmetsp:Transcript_38177/g.110236  ORF Transcript_38177/g.110236 Transcript_38177/m.110236 type:complete len:201 (+) Transcript_38177:644-1246(+)